MIGYYGKEDRRLLTEIEEHLNLIRHQMILLTSILRQQQILQEKILATMRPVVALKFSLGVPEQNR